jgi:flagellar biosynthesis protein FlhG
VRNKKPTTPGSRIISVGGGKGGVGKSLVSTNLAVTIAQAGHEVVLCDLDLSAANLHLMLGLTHPQPGIATLLSGEGELEEALTPTSIPRLSLLAGSGGTVAADNINHPKKLRIIRKLRALKADYVVIDVGAAVGYNALDFFELGQQRIVVATPQVTSMHDAYGFLKRAVLRTLRHHSSRRPQAELLEPALASKEGDKVKDLLLRIREHDNAFGDKVVEILKRFGGYLVGNQVSDPSQVGALNAVSKMVEDYLGIALPILGWIPSTPRLAESVNERRPLMARPTQNEPREMRAFRGIVDALLASDVPPEEELLVELVDEGEASTPPPLDPEAPVVEPAVAAAVSARPAQATPPPIPPRPPAVPLSPPAAAAPPPPPRPPEPVAVGSEPTRVVDPQVHLKPVVYVRPSRKRKPESEEQKRKRAMDAEGRRRKITLPGMPSPRRS